MKRLVLAAILLTCLMATQAWAHGTGHSGNDNGDGVITFYLENPTMFQNKNGFQGIKDLNHLANIDGSKVPHWRRTSVRSNAEVIQTLMPYNDPQNKHGTNGAVYCDNRMVGAYTEEPGPDYAVLDAECPGWHMTVDHEFGHDLGFGTPTQVHHDCTDYWLRRTVNVGCNIRLNDFGSHDKHYARYDFIKGT